MTIEKIERRICDRCGFTEVGTAEPRDWAQLTSKALGLHISGADGRTVDICPDCRSELLNWWHDKEPKPL
jgi:hypothetical protein